MIGERGVQGVTVIGFVQRSTVLVLAFFLGSDPASAQDQFSPDRSAIDQLAELARRHNVPEDEVSAALFDGRLAPAREDLWTVLREFDPRSCAEIEANPEPAEFAPGHFDCEQIRPLTRPARDGWNARFGLPPHDQRFIYVRSAAVGLMEGFRWLNSDMTEEQVMAHRFKDRFTPFWDQFSEDPAPYYLGAHSWRDPYDRHREAFLKRDRYQNDDGTTDEAAKESDRIAANAQRVADRAMSMWFPDEDDILEAFERRRADLGMGQLISIRSLELADACLLVRKDRYTALCNVRLVMDTQTGSAVLDNVFGAAGALERFRWIELDRPDDTPTWQVVDFWDECTATEGQVNCSGRQ